jgi:Fe-S cluster assembly protein SufD
MILSAMRTDNRKRPEPARRILDYIDYKKRMDTITYFKERFKPGQPNGKEGSLHAIREDAFHTFNTLGIPTGKQEEWKYTRIKGLFNKDYLFGDTLSSSTLSQEQIFKDGKLTGHEQANILVFINGLFSIPLSVICSPELQVMPLEQASSGEYKDIISKHLGHSSAYIGDGINALNTAFFHGGAFIQVKRGQVTQHPVYIYHIADASQGNIFAQPRTLVHLGENAHLQIVETFITLGGQESFTNKVTEIVVEKDARLEYYKIQNDNSRASQVSTTHIRQIGKSHTLCIVISLGGAVIRNNLNLIFEAPNCESHLYGLYCLNNQSHIDNHTVVDNTMPNCLSNELYKGIVTDQATAVFNGKIFVRKDAQKTNAYQSNKNLLLTDTATVNSKPQLEIFADDVKCSHGCTVGSLDEEALFYLRSRGLHEDYARSLLLQAFALDILEKIKSVPIRTYVNDLISQRLEIDLS